MENTNSSNVMVGLQVGKSIEQQENTANLTTPTSLPLSEKKPKRKRKEKEELNELLTSTDGNLTGAPPANWSIPLVTGMVTVFDLFVQFLSTRYGFERNDFKLNEEEKTTLVTNLQVVLNKHFPTAKYIEEMVLLMALVGIYGSKYEMALKKKKEKETKKVDE